MEIELLCIVLVYSIGKYSLERLLICFRAAVIYNPFPDKVLDMSNTGLY